MIKPKRKVKCDICKEWFVRWNTFTKVCQNPECIIENAKRQKAKDKRKAVKEFNESDKKYLKKVAQQVVNKYVRLRDSHIGCISCKTTSAKYDSGHYLPQSMNSALRYNTNNIFKQCYRCNRMLSSNHDEYRKALIHKFGEDFVAKLENRKGEIKKYDVEYLQKLIRVFRKKNKQMEKRIQYT